jgi:hypothetical protein
MDVEFIKQRIHFLFWSREREFHCHSNKQVKYSGREQVQQYKKYIQK